jgi:hypothetical protein
MKLSMVLNRSTLEVDCDVAGIAVRRTTRGNALLDNKRLPRCILVNLQMNHLWIAGLACIEITGVRKHQCGLRGREPLIDDAHGGGRITVEDVIGKAPVRGNDQRGRRRRTAFRLCAAFSQPSNVAALDTSAVQVAAGVVDTVQVPSRSTATLLMFTPALTPVTVPMLFVGAETHAIPAPVTPP